MQISVSGGCLLQRQHAYGQGRQVLGKVQCPPMAVWTRPTPDKDENFTKPAYIPTPSQSPVVQPYWGDDRPLYAPTPNEFQQAEAPEQEKEMPKGPNMPERRPDPIPAGNPKEKPPAGEPEKEAPPEPAKKE
eukprot:GHRR01000677.1.p1 GENE.GHRR01000677.1~~GHRR01000677.1.p1  ORF type:complete len:132 (+),score=28.49 GHRR01000677.1:283-678(+)